MGTESPKRNAFALGFSLPLASLFRATETKTLFGWRFGSPLYRPKAVAKTKTQKLFLDWFWFWSTDEKTMLSVFGKS